MFELSPLYWASTLLILITAYTLRGITGFGSGLIAIPLLALFMPLNVVVPMIGLLDVSASLLHSWRHRQKTEWSLLWPLFPFTLIGVAAALFIFTTVNPLLLTRFLGAIVLLFAAYNLFFPELLMKRSPAWPFVAGLSGGIVGTLFGTGGPFYVIYLHIFRLDKGVFRATVASLFAVDGLLRVAGYTVTGFYSAELLMLALLGIPVMLASLALGGRIHTSISQQAFRRAIGLLLLASGTILLLK